MEVWIEGKKPKVLGATSFTLALLLHIVFFVAFVIFANFRFKPKETVIPIDLTVVVNENLDGNENEPPPLDDPPPPPPPQPAPPKVSPPPPPPPQVRNVDAVVKVREKPEKPKETQEDRINRMRQSAKEKDKPKPPKPEPPKTEPPKKTKEQLMKERLEQMRRSASVTKVKIKVPDAPSGNGRTERQTRSVKEIQDLLNQGYRPGTKTQLASSEVQRCVSLIQAAYLAKWERPPWTASLKEAQLKVKFLPGGRVASWTLSKSSGDAAADKTVRRAAAMVSEVRGLSDSFIKSNCDGVIVRFKVTP